MIALFFLIIDDMVSLDEVQNTCCNLHVPFYVSSASKTQALFLVLGLLGILFVNHEITGRSVFPMQVQQQFNCGKRKKR